jgi:CheY-like chemotaxis protein
MSRILLADDSPHAQRMGERILREEGYEVVTVTDGETALIRLADVDPDVVLADVFLPTRSGYELCEQIKKHPRHRHARVVLLAGPLDAVDEQEMRRVNADGLLRKPLEASLVLQTVRPLIEAARAEREQRPETDIAPEPLPIVTRPAPARGRAPSARSGTDSRRGDAGLGCSPALFGGPNQPADRNRGGSRLGCGLARDD